MKIFVIGAGKWGINIVRTLSELNALSGIMETNSNRATELRQQFPNTLVLESMEQLAVQNPDAVAIATPVATHFAIASECLRRGWHVFVEKPMTASLNEAIELQKLSEKYQRTLMVGHLLLYQPAIRWLKSFLLEDGLGKIFSIHQERLNFGRARTHENALWSLGVHDIAVLLYLVGEPPLSVSHSSQSVITQDVEDEFYVHLKFANYTMGHLHISWLWPERSRRMSIIGEKGMLVFEEHSQEVILHRKNIDTSLNHTDNGSEVVFKDPTPPLRIELSHFINCIADGTKPVSDGMNGLEVIRVMNLIESQRGN